MRVALCDDNALFLQELEAQVNQASFVGVVHSFSDWKSLREAMEKGQTYDAVLMDIDLAGAETGIDAAETLYQRMPAAKIIFVTGYTERFVQQVFLHHSNLSGYLTKPVDPALLQANLQKIADGLEQREEETLLLRINGAVTGIPFREINFIESRSHTVTFHMRNRTLAAYEKLGDLQQKLPPSFCRCHKSFIVNMRQIQQIQYTGILLKNGEQVPVSRTKYAQTRERYFRFMGREL